MNKRKNSAPTKRGPFTFTSHGRTYKVDVVSMSYGNGRTALVLLGQNGERVAVATVNLPDALLQPGHLHIKTWAENESMLDFLTSNGIVRDTGVDVPTGFCQARVVELMEVA